MWSSGAEEGESLDANDTLYPSFSQTFTNNIDETVRTFGNSPEPSTIRILGGYDNGFCNLSEFGKQHLGNQLPSSRQCECQYQTTFNRSILGHLC